MRELVVAVEAGDAGRKSAGIWSVTLTTVSEAGELASLNKISAMETS